MSPKGHTRFHVDVTPARGLLLRGELDMHAVEVLQAEIDRIMVPGQPIVLDLTQLTFLDSSAIQCFIRACAESGHRVVLHNTSPIVRRTLDLVNLQPEAWVFDGDGAAAATA